MHLIYQPKERSNEQKIILTWGSAPNPGIFEDMILNTGGKIGAMADFNQPLQFYGFLLKFNYSTGGDADDRDMIQGGLCCPRSETS